MLNGNNRTTELFMYLHISGYLEKKKHKNVVLTPINEC